MRALQRREIVTQPQQARHGQSLYFCFCLLYLHSFHGGFEIMNVSELQSRLDAVIARHDLLQHPFYRTWAAGQLRAEDLRRYAGEYYHHVAAFPAYLSALHSRLPDGELRRAVLRNLAEEEISGAAHSEMWLDFAEGLGAERQTVRAAAPSKSTQELVAAFRRLAAQQTPLAALGAFYAYESQVARIAGVKAQGLRQWYGAGDKTCAYFDQHATQDAHHARVWAEQIAQGLDADASSEEGALAAVEEAAVALWKSLDGIHRPLDASAACA
jgi:pyrroloquinoline-quinone synthase